MEDLVVTGSGESYNQNILYERSHFPIRRLKKYKKFEFSSLQFLKTPVWYYLNLLPF